MNRLFLIFLFVAINSNCFASVTAEAFQNFLKNYYSSNERTFWPETIYAIENDYDDDMVIFCLDKFGLQSPLYLSRKAKVDFNNNTVDWSKGEDKTKPVDVRNILVTCTKKKRLFLLKELLQYFPEKDLRKISEYRISYHLKYGYSKDSALNSSVTSEIQALNIAIREINDCVEYVNLFLHFNKILVHFYDYNYDSKTLPSHVYPLAEAFIKLDVEVIKLLLENGAQIDIPFYNGRTILYWSIQQDRLDLVELLLEKNPYAVNNCLNHAIQLKNKNAVILALNYGADALGALEVAFAVADQEIIDILMAIECSN